MENLDTVPPELKSLFEDAPAATPVTKKSAPQPLSTPASEKMPETLPPELASLYEPAPTSEAAPKRASFVDQIASYGFGKVPKAVIDTAHTIADVPTLKEIREKAPWFAIHPDQHRLIYDYDQQHPEQGEGFVHAAGQALKNGAQGIWGTAVGVGDIVKGGATTLLLQAADEFGGAPYEPTTEAELKQAHADARAGGEAVAQTLESLADTYSIARATGNTYLNRLKDWAVSHHLGDYADESGATPYTPPAGDDLLRKTKEERFKDHLYRETYHTLQAQQKAQDPSAIARMMDWASPVVRDGISILVHNATPSVQELKSHFNQDELHRNAVAAAPSIEQIRENYPDLDEQGLSDLRRKFIADEELKPVHEYRQGLIASKVDDISDSMRSELNSTMPSSEAMMAGEMLMPFGNDIDVGLRAVKKGVEGLKGINRARRLLEHPEPGFIEQADMIRKMADETAAVDAPQTPGWAESASQGVADKVESAKAKWDSTLKEAPELVQKGVKATLGAGGGYLTGELLGGDEHGKSYGIAGALAGLGLPSLLETPQFAADALRSRRMVKGTDIGTFENLAKGPGFSKTTQKTATAMGGGRGLDYIIDNTARLAKEGVNTAVLATALGVFHDQTPEEIVKNAGDIAAFQVLHGGASKLLGHGEEQNTKTKDFAIRRTVMSMDPQSQANFAKTVDWQNEVDRLQNNYRKALDEYNQEAPPGDGSDKQQKAAALVVARRQLDGAQSASVETRAEYARSLGALLTDIDTTANGVMPNRNIQIHLLNGDEIAGRLAQYNNFTPQQIQQIVAQRGFHVGAPSNAKGEPAPRFGESGASHIVINMDNVRAMMALNGEPLHTAIAHEAGHFFAKTREYQEATAKLQEELFGKTVEVGPNGEKEYDGKGLYGPKELSDMFETRYLEGKSDLDKVHMAQLTGVWDYTAQKVDEARAAAYMKEEVLADHAGLALTSERPSKTQALSQWARAKFANEQLGKATADTGGEIPAEGVATKLKFTPEQVAAGRRALDAMKSFNGALNTRPEGMQPKLTKRQIANNETLLNKLGKDSGMFETVHVAQVIDANGNPVGKPVRLVTENPQVGEWKKVTDPVTGDQTVELVPDSGFAKELPPQMGAAAAGLKEGESIKVSTEVDRDANTGKPIERSDSELRRHLYERGNAIRKAIRMVADDGHPNRFRAYTPDGLSFRGQFSESQLRAIAEIPEDIVPAAFKKALLDLNKAVVAGEGQAFLALYTQVMNAKGQVKPFAPKPVELVPIGFHLSKKGNLTTTIVSLTGLQDKLNSWLRHAPGRLELWNGSRDAFMADVSKYLDNMDPKTGEGRVPGVTGLHEEGSIAEQKKQIIRDLFNMSTVEERANNPYFSDIPKEAKKGQKLLGFEESDDESSNPNEVVRSYSLHNTQNLQPSNGRKFRANYADIKTNFLPEGEAPQSGLNFLPSGESEKEWSILNKVPAKALDEIHANSEAIGDVDTAKRVTDAAAYRNGYYPTMMYHGTPSGGFSYFDTYGSRYGLFGQGAYFTDSPEIAKSYADRRGRKIDKESPDAPQVYKVYLKAERPMNMDAPVNKEAWKKSSALERGLLHEGDIEDARTNEDVVRKIEEAMGDEGLLVVDAGEVMYNAITSAGFDSVVHKGGGRVGDGARHNVTIVFHPEQVKSAEPFTHDKDGKLIPLSERFNSESTNINFLPSGENLGEAARKPKTQASAPTQPLYLVKTKDDEK